MKRILAVLVLTVAGLLTSTLLLTPGAVQAAEPEQQGLQVIDSRAVADLIVDEFGDPNGWGDGFGNQQDNDSAYDLETSDLSVLPDGINSWDQLIAYLVMAYWTL